MLGSWKGSHMRPKLSANIYLGKMKAELSNSVSRSRIIELGSSVSVRNMILLSSTLCFRKTSPITYRNVAAPNFHPPYTLDRYGQLDFILINRKWKNAVTNAESNLQTSVTTDHKLLVANIRTKLAAKKQPCQTRSARYRTHTTEQLHRYNEKVQELIEAAQPSQSADPFEVWAEVLNQAATHTFTPIPTDQKKTVHL